MYSTLPQNRKKIQSFRPEFRKIDFLICSSQKPGQFFVQICTVKLKQFNKLLQRQFHQPQNLNCTDFTNLIQNLRTDFPSMFPPNFLSDFSDAKNPKFPPTSYIRRPTPKSAPNFTNGFYAEFPPKFPSVFFPPTPKI